jgi:uncharacterized protein YehS (DUF1456 family)
MAEHYTNQKMAEFSVAKMADKIIKWLRKMDEIHYSKMVEFALPEWLTTL